jgi:acyl transferase domain-containing protein/acyl carrier protein/NAD(P)-dependent dehydrogenase (short-subunit alcohol dehydrogenase family)/3-hydroxymyristoyl/3-hydroxydecanoyl-(acyl carrier protein) dehydratase
MEETANRAIAIVGAGAILPDAANVAAFWENVKKGRYSITEVMPERWDPALYYDPDPNAPDKTYSKIGGWVREWNWDPMKWHLPIPPRVTDAMDLAQKWAIAATREALEDYGYPQRPLDADRVAVILGNAMAGERHYQTALRLNFPEYAHELAESGTFASLPAGVRTDITRELHDRIGKRLPEVTEDSMPGELANCIAGRIANIYNFHGPNFVCDAACASAMAAMSAAVEGLVAKDFDAVITGGIDRNMGAQTFVKFCKIGALSATGTRPYADGADGFVMGEGCAIFLLKRLADAERDGDKIYAVFRGFGASSDGKGKGITAPNPVGQKFCLERAWQNAGLSPATATLIEGHGTSTRVGDVVEAQCMANLLSSQHLPTHSVALGSVKSNIGHLKGAAGAAGLLKTALALREKVLPPSVNCDHPSPDIDFAHSPLYVNTELKPWTVPSDTPRRAGVSAFGFGGTNFHIVLEEHLPGRLTGNGKRSVAVSTLPQAPINEVVMNTKEVPAVSVSSASLSACKPPLRGALVIGTASEVALAERLRVVVKNAQAGSAPAPTAPTETDLHAPERLAIDYTDAADLADKAGKALKALAANQAAVWKALRAQGIFRGHGPAPKVAFLYTGQGSQYVNMLRTLHDAEALVAETFAEADRVMTPLLGKPLTDFVFVDQADPNAVAKADDDLRQTAITQPAVLAIDLALTRLLAAYGIRPDMTMGHSLGEYGALVAAGALPFEDALEAVSARGRGMTQVAVADKGRMAAVFAPLNEIERILKTVNGYVVIANINSEHQAVIGGASNAVTQAMEVLRNAGYDVAELPVSHAFHTSIVAPASEPLRKELERLHLESPRLPIVANVNGEFYPTGPDVVPQMLDLLARQVASPVQFIKGLRTLYEAGARIFVEVGPKKALQGFAEDVLGDRGDVVSLFTNHPKIGDIASFNQALCGLYAAGLGRGTAAVLAEKPEASTPVAPSPFESDKLVAKTSAPATQQAARANGDHLTELGHLMAEVLERARKIQGEPDHRPANQPVVITGAALGLPGTEHIFDDANLARILRGDQFIDLIPTRLRKAMLDKHITRLMKSDNGGPTFETINNVADVIKLAGRGGAFDLESEFGVSADRRAALDRDTQLAIAVGIDALRDAGIPLVMRYKTTSKGSQLPDRWALPDAMRDDTGVIFASAFPGCDSFADEMSHYYADHSRREQLGMLETLLSRAAKSNGDSILEHEIERRTEDLRDAIEKEPYVFDRRFLLRTLAMGHSQFAEFIGARGPNTQINSACASTTQAVALAQDWISAGRCRRVIIVSADDVTSDHLIEWFGAGFLASGAAATDEVVEEAATPFDRRRHGLIVGMGAAGIVVESAESARERGMQSICEVLSTATANSAFHGTRLDVQHIGQVMENLIAQAEAHSGISRQQIAPHTVFVSHETYTPARGGSASAEIHALRRVFGDAADQVVIANTKGMTGHAMATGIEDVVAVKALETGIVPPVANFKEIDPELGTLNLSKGGAYPIEYAIRLGAGFGSQISMTLLHWVGTKDSIRRRPNALGYAYRIVDEDCWKAWLSRVAGYPTAELEVVHRTLRIRDQGAATRVLDAAKKSNEVAHPTPVKPQAPLVDVLLAPPLSPVVESRVQAQTPLSVPPTHPTPAPQADPVKEKVLALVAEKTGYPVDMLDLDLDLEADLGVDTVKQAEVMATIREAYGIARDDKIKLRDFPTLAHVIRFVYENRPNLRTAQLAPIPVPATEVPAPKVEERHEAQAISVLPTTDAADPVKERILALMVEKTGYPQDMLDLDLDLEADLGIDTVKQAEMFAAIREMYSIPRDEDRKLRDYPTLAHVIRFVYEKRPDLGSTPASWPSSPASALPVSITPITSEVLAPAPAPLVTPADSEDPIKKMVLQIVAEKTGYPEDMLDLDLDLEADLGVDTVKQAEMFAAVRAAYNIPRDESMKLRDFPTLAHVIKFAHDRSARAKASVPSVKPAQEEQRPAAPAASVSAQLVRPVLASLDAANSIPRRVPVATLRPPLTVCKLTGVKLDGNSRVVLMPDKGGVGQALKERLSELGVEVLCIEGNPDADTLSGILKSWTATGPVNGVFWLPALDNEGDLRKMDSAAWHESVRVRVKLLYTAMRALYEDVGRPGTFLVAATRLGGHHGYDDAGAVAPLGGAVTGFAKTYKRERAESLVKAVDFESNGSPKEIADLLIAETLRDPGAVEIGYTSGQRWTVGLQEQPAIDGQHGMVLDKNSVFVITGAAGSIVSAITADLAAASGGTFYLLDLVPKPDPDNTDLKRFVNDRENLKRDLFARIQTRGERATPALVEKELASLERARAAQSAIDAVRAAGGTPHYFSVNLADAEAVSKIIDHVRQGSGRIDVLLHAAGIERSHSLPDKDSREFDLVFDVKSDGFFNLLYAIDDMPLGAAVAFSSIAGRFGNAGQTDYSSANDLLCKITSSFRTTRPATRGIAIDWTAWGGIGMATRGSIPKMMELAGIDMLPPEAGIPLIRRELTAGATRGEIVIGKRLGVLLNEWDSTGGLDRSAEAGKQLPAMGPMAGKVASMNLHHGYAVETTLDPPTQPFLHDHQIDGTPVLPGVMGIEAFAEAALCLLPGWRIEAIEDISFIAPFKFYRSEPRGVRIETQIHPQGEQLVADCRLIGYRSFPNAKEPQATTHFTACVRLAKQAVQTPAARAFVAPAGTCVEAADIYRLYFHGPAYKVVERAWWDGKRVVGLFAKGLPPNHHPSELDTVAAPRLIELCFQTAGVWELGIQGRMGLPQHVHHVSLFRKPNVPDGRLYAVVTPDEVRGSFDAEVLDEKGNCYLRLSDYQTVAFSDGVNKENLKSLQAIMSGEAVLVA